MRIALRFSEPENQPLTEAATQVLRTRLSEVAEDEGLDPADDMFWWPPEPTPEQQAALTSLLAAVPQNQAITLIADAYTGGHLDVDTAAALLQGQGGAQGTIQALQRTEGQHRGDLARACHRLDAEQTLAAVKELQDQALSIELVAAIAEHDPDAAFAPVAAAWSRLTGSERDVVMDLLDEHATPNQRALLETIASDTLHENAPRRRRAVSRLAELMPPGSDVPPAVLLMLEAGNAETRRVAVEAIGRIRPHSLAAVDRLRSLAARTDASARAAMEVLEELAGLYVSEVSEHPPQKKRVDLLGLLGRTAHVSAIDVLLSHLGQEAIDDHAEVRVAAATAIEELSSAVEFPLEQQRAVGALLDEEGGEDNGAAREALSSALTRLTLGPDQALEILYRLVDFHPKGDPDALFGPEKTRLIRHLQLYAKEEGRGEVARPQRLMQLDLIAQQLLRAAYLRVGTSERLKEKIRSGGKDPQMGELLPALESVAELQGSRADLTVVHKLRSEKTEYTHPGEEPTSEDETTALNCFQSGAKRVVGVLEAHVSRP